MSVALAGQFHLNTPPLPAVLMEAIMRPVAAWQSFGGAWADLEIRDTKRRTIGEVDGEVQVGFTRSSKVLGLPNTEVEFACYSFMHCWRFHGGRPERSAVPFYILARDEAFCEKVYGRPSLYGQASIVFDPAGPFVALINQDDGPGTINERVGENLEMLSDGLLSVCEALDARSMKLYTDDGQEWPLNAHLAYYRDSSAILEDIQVIADVWERGIEELKYPPLRNYDESEHRSLLHLWRTEDQRRELWQRLRDCIHAAPHVTERHVAQLWESGRFDNYEVGAGRAVLEYPYYLNDFLDRYFLELLELAN